MARRERPIATLEVVVVFSFYRYDPSSVESQFHEDADGNIVCKYTLPRPPPPRKNLADKSLGNAAQG